MRMSTLARSRAARFVATVAAISTGVSTSAAGIAAFALAAHAAAASLHSILEGHVVGPRTKPLLGPLPGRDEVRAAWWAEISDQSAHAAQAAVAVAIETGALAASTVFPLALAQDSKSRTGQPGKAPGEATLPVVPSGTTQTTEATGTLPSEANTNTGNLLVSRSLVRWASLGNSAVDFTLHHNSLGTHSGAIGHSWSHSYDSTVTHVPGRSATLRMADGLTVPYLESGGTFLPPVGWHHQLVRHANGSWTLIYHDQRRDEFDAQGRLDRVRDRAGNSVQIVRGTDGRILAVRSADGRELRFQYRADGRVSSVADPAGRMWSFAYNGSGQLASITYPADGGQGLVRTFTYNSQHDILTERDLRGGLWQHSYDSGSRLATSTDPLGNRTTIGYTASSTTVTLPGGQRTTHHYSQGLLVSTVDAAGFSESFVYDSSRNVVQHVDKRGFSTHFSYDARGNVLTSTDALGRTWSYTYSLQNDTLSETSPLGNTTLFAYDAGGGVSQVIDPLGNVAESNTFDQFGQLTSTSDALGRTTTFEHDGRGDVVRVVEPGGIETVFHHDVLGRTISESVQGGKSWSATYDHLGRHVATIHPDGSALSWSYDGEGALTKAVDEMGGTESWTYDAAGRLTSYSNALGQTRTYAHNANGWQTRVTDSKGNAVNQGRTPRGELAWQTLADGTHEAWTYLGTGEVASYAIGGRTTTYAYDSAGQLVGADYPASPDVTLAYDADGRRTQMVDSSGTTTWQYDNAGQAVRLSQPKGVTEYRYDASGAVTWTNEVGRGATVTLYDAAGRVSRVTNGAGESTQFEYDARGLASRTVYANGVREDWAYDERLRPVSVTLRRSDGTSILSQSYAYDSASRLTRAVRNGVATDFGYDVSGQLVSESSPGYAATYSYDANGNRATRTVNGVVETYAYDAGDKLVSVFWPGGSKVYTYDSSGRSASVTAPSGTTVFSYDDESRLTSVAGPNGTTSHQYNGMDALVGASGPGGSRSYHRDGVGVTDPVLHDGVSSMTPSISVRTGSITRFQHSDLKNFLVQTDASQNPVAQRAYDAFGNAGPGMGTWSGQQGYGGVFGYTETAGLRQLGHRVYDASTGRFLTRDPAADGRNWYAYGSGLHAPTGSADPDGLTPKVIIVILVIRGAKHIYKVYKTSKKAKEAAKLAKRGGKVRKDRGHNGGPRHYHNEGQRKNIHYTSEAAAKEAKRRGAEHWRNFDPSKHHQVLHH